MNVFSSATGGAVNVVESASAAVDDDESGAMPTAAPYYAGGMLGLGVAAVAML